MDNKEKAPLMNEIVEYLDPLLCIRMDEEVYERHLETRYGEWHYHREIEFLAIKEGTLGIETTEEMHELHAGDIIVLGAFEVHRSLKSGKEPLRYLLLQFDPNPYFDPSTVAYLSAFTDREFPLSQLNYIFRDEKVFCEEAFGLIERLSGILERKDKGYSMAISSIVKHLLWILIREDRRVMLPGESDHPYRVRIRPALSYIEQHLSEKITVHDVCRLLNFSYHHFIKLFHKTVGLTFTEYLHYRRIKQAERMLLTENMNLAQIGEAIGIPSSAQFHKLFRRYHGCSPKEYRERRKPPSLQTQESVPYDI